MEPLNKSDAIREYAKTITNCSEIARLVGVNESTVRYVLSGGKTHDLRRRCLRNLSIAFDTETIDQMDALCALWGESRSEVVRILVDWGLEALDGREAKAVKEAAGTCRDGEV